MLIVSYYFPPVPSVGSVRMAGLAKFLPHFGWQPTVVTPRHPERLRGGATVVETDDDDRAVRFKRALGLRPDLALRDQFHAGPATTPSSKLKAGVIELAKLLVAFPDANRGWVRHALAASTDEFDVLLTSSPPVSAHLAGRRIKRHQGTPWVADLRDLWADDHNSTAPRWRRALERGLERRTFADADALVTVSEPLADRLRHLYPTLPVRSILNGFDPELASRGGRLTETFTLTHTGTFYQGRRDPTVLFEALGALIARGQIDRSRLRVRLFSRQEPWLASLVQRCGLSDVVELRGWVAREDALRAQQESQILLLLHWGAERERGVYTGKIFEYLAARRPVLVVGGSEGVLSGLLRETGAGVQVVDREGLERQLLAWWCEFVEHGSVLWQGNEAALARYSHLRMAGEFAEVLDSVHDPRRPVPAAGCAP